MNKLTQLEIVALQNCEETIRRGRATFIEVGTALCRIRDERLYVAKGYGSFNEYCEAVWEWKKSYVSRVIQAADIARELPIGNFLETESQARELAKVPEADRAEVVEKAAKSGKVTAKSLRAAMRTTAEAASNPLPSHDDEETPHIKTADQEFAEALGMTPEQIKAKQDKIQHARKNPLPALLIDQCQLAIDSLRLVVDPEFVLDCDSFQQIASDVNKAATELKRYAKVACPQQEAA